MAMNGTRTAITIPFPDVGERHLWISVGACRLTITRDFGGTLQRDAYARISTGLSAVDLRVPRATAARIISEAVLGQLEASSGFTTREGGYWTDAALAGGTPLLTIHANVALGSLRLHAT